MKNRILLTLFLMCAAGAAQAWWKEEWTVRKSFTLDTTPTGAEMTQNLTEVPVLIRLHGGNFPGFFDAAEGGKDFRFLADDDLTPLKYHVESFDPISELAYVWVKMPTLAANSNAQKIWLYYGNPMAPKGDDSAATFDVAQSLVLHFSADMIKPVDASAYTNNPLIYTAQTDSAGFIGAAASFDEGQQIRLPDSSSLQVLPENGWTFSAWIKPQATSGERLLMRKGTDLAWVELRVVDGQLQAFVQNGESDAEPVASELVPLVPEKWTHMALTLQAEHMSLYLDGQLAADIPVTLVPIAGELRLGAEEAGYLGWIDEVRVSNRARDADWIAAMQVVQGNDQLVVSGAEERAGGESSGGTSFFGSILSNVSTDGWVVIGLLGIMSAVSWMVMVLKAMSLNRIQADNREFTQAYAGLDANSTAALDMPDTAEDQEMDGSPVLNSVFGEHDHYQSSILYSIYHVGIRETEKRLGATVGAQAMLSPQAIRVVRAALDATAVRETQKLNSLMVLLTIAISGGPFLGLLGTVMGVMITFAAIAITGDVNIDAIAPGVSAALMTTVAGLFVAIPALFGYNYLATRIRDMTADMHVFVDEFEAKLAESYT